MSDASTFGWPKLVVIHGWGGSFSESLYTIKSMLQFRSTWHDGAFYVDKRIGMILRRLLNEQEPDPVTRGFQKLIIRRLLAASVEPHTDADPTPENDQSVRIFEYRLLKDYNDVGLPITPSAREQRARALEAEALKDLKDQLPALNAIAEQLRQQDNTMTSESQARELIHQESAVGEAAADLVPVLESLRDMHETGGDLDTVTSAVFYTHWLYGEARREHRDLIYGRDYRFVFVNYHEGIKHLEAEGPGSVLMADLPIGALPDFEEHVRYLADKGVKMERFEDHHPYTGEQLAMLERLRDEGLIGYLALSGPLIDNDEELEEEELKCGADMVYESCIQGRPYDNDGCRELRKAAHSEDFVTDRYDLGKLLTGLIKGGICKIELAELMLASIPGNDCRQRLEDRGWGQKVREWNEYLATVEDELLENTYVLKFERPEGSLAEQGGAALGDSSDMPVSPRKARDNLVRVLVAHSVFPEPGKPKINVGKACEFFSRTMPDVDYFFFCYGSGLAVTRRLNQADLTFNLSKLMPVLGGPGDGGHAGAAVCRPEANDRYPKRLLGRVKPANFKAFVRYLADRIAGEGYKLKGIENRSSPLNRKKQQGGLQLLIVTAAALLIGLLLVFLHPDFKPDAVKESNQDFFPQIQADDEEGAE